MKQIFKVLGIALMAVCMGASFVSCEDDETTTNNNQNNQNNQNVIDLTGFNLAEVDFHLTQCYCEDFSAEIQSWLMRGIADGTLTYDMYGDPSAASNYYQGWQFNLLVNSTCRQDFTVDKYDYTTQELDLSTSEDIYEGTVELTQDNEKIYMSWTGESYRGGHDAILEGWYPKSRLQ